MRDEWILALPAVSLLASSTKWDCTLGDTANVLPKENADIFCSNRTLQFINLAILAYRSLKPSPWLWRSRTPPVLMRSHQRKVLTRIPTLPGTFQEFRMQNIRQSIWKRKGLPTKDRMMPWATREVTESSTIERGAAGARVVAGAEAEPAATLVIVTTAVEIVPTM